MSSAESISSWRTSGAGRPALRLRISAATPATWGAAKEVPLLVP